MQRAMISLVVPTRNREYTLRLVARSFFDLEQVDELIFVIDAGSDGTESLLQELSREHPDRRLVILKNSERIGASACRNRGVEVATNPYVLFCDDDEYLEPQYAKTCLDKLLRLRAGAVSGRRVYMEPGETISEALTRFGTGLRKAAPFRKLICEFVNGARFEGDISLPLTNAVILTHRELLRRFPYDPHYARGNGYREESDFQMNLFVHNYDIYVTNEVHSVHLPLASVRAGGQRTAPLRRIYWSVYYTRYFFGKYYAAYSARVGLSLPRPLAVAAFAGFAVYRETLRPPLYAVAKGALRWLSRREKRGARLQVASAGHP